MPFPPHAPRLPNSPDLPDGGSGLRAADALPLRGVTLLVVDDSRFACDALRLVCVRSGARLRRAETLAAARAHLGAHRPDVVIVDLGLPDGRGEDLIADLRLRKVPVLAISGDPDARASALAAGALAFVEKPISGIAAFQHLVLRLIGLDLPPTAPAAQLPLSADPLAFHDDLARASTLIGGVDDGYATGFLRSLGRSAGDHALEAAALAAATGTGQDALARLVALRLARPPLPLT